MKRRNFLSTVVAVLCVPLAVFGIGRKRTIVTGYDPTTKVATLGLSKGKGIDEIKAVPVGNPPRWKVTITYADTRPDHTYQSDVPTTGVFYADAIEFSGGKGDA